MARTKKEISEPVKLVKTVKPDKKETSVKQKKLDKPIEKTACPTKQKSSKPVSSVKQSEPVKIKRKQADITEPVKSEDKPKRVSKSKSNSSKNDSINNNTVRNTDKSVHSSDKKKQRTEPDTVTKQKRSQNAEQKSNVSDAAAGKDRKVRNKSRVGNKENGSVDTAKSKSDSGKHGKSKRPKSNDKSSAVADNGRKRGKQKSVAASEQSDAVDNELETDGKTVRRRKRDEKKYDVIMGPVTLTSKPKKVKDEPWLVEIEINGVPKQVSSWSIRKGQYIQGLDSEFLVHNYALPKKNKVSTA